MGSGSHERAHRRSVYPAGTGAGGAERSVSLLVRGRALRLRVSAVLGPETFGALSQADVAVMPLADLQRLAGLPEHITRILVQAAPGREAAVRRELRALAAGRLEVAAADQDVALLGQALRPSDQASALFAAISVLLGVLLAFNALLLTVPERRRAIAELRLVGARRSAIVQMLFFQALCLGLAASLVGLLGGYALSRGVFHQSTGYLAEAFTLGTRTVLTAQPLLLALIAGVLATVLASAVPLLDLRRGRSAGRGLPRGRRARQHALPRRTAGIGDRRRDPAGGRDRAVRERALAGAERLRAAGAGNACSRSR